MTDKAKITHWLRQAIDQVANDPGNHWFSGAHWDLIRQVELLLAEFEQTIGDRVRAELAEDVRIVLNQRVTHAHMRPGIWDDGNVGDPKFGTGAGGTRCIECAARARLAAFAAGSSPDTTTPEGRNDA